MGKSFFFTSTLVALLIGVWFFIQRIEKKRLLDPAWKITYLISKGKDKLPAAYLTELLGLSSDQPTPFLLFDAKAKEKELQKSPVIKKIKVKKIRPHTVFVNYTLREPIARVADYENVAIDGEGHIFRLVPFFTPKVMCEFFLGLPSFGKEVSFEEPLTSENFLLAKRVQKLLMDESLRVLSIDTSNVVAPSLGSREIIVKCEEELFLSTKTKETSCVFPVYIRLSPESITQQLGNYLKLRKKMLDDYRKQISLEDQQEEMYFRPKTIDMRIEKMAFIDE